MRKFAASAVMVLAGLLVFATGATAHNDNNAGDVWVDNVGQEPGPGHENDPHLSCDNINLWGNGLSDASGTYAIDGWPPSGSQELVYSSTWSYVGTGNQVISVIDVNTLVTNALADGDVPQQNQGLHFKLQFSQDPQNHKTFWVNCTDQEPTPTPSPTDTPGPSDTPVPTPTETAVPTPTETSTPTPTDTPTPTPQPTDSPQPSDTPTPGPTSTPSGEPTPTPTVTPEPTGTLTPTPVSTSSSVPVAPTPPVEHPSTSGPTTPDTGSATGLDTWQAFLGLGLIIAGLAWVVFARFIVARRERNG